MKYLEIMLLGAIGTIFIFGCKKEKPTPSFTINGILLESTSNPTPVSNFKMNLYQKESVGIIGSIAGLSQYFFTKSDGSFEVTYEKQVGTGFSESGVNSKPISISTNDQIQYNNFYMRWSPLTANKDTNLGTHYLLKNIDRLIIQIKFNRILNLNDTIWVKTENGNVVNEKVVIGPQQIGNTIPLDTIYQYKTSKFFISTQKYYAVLRSFYFRYNNQVYSLEPSLELPIGDENFRKWIIEF